MRLFAAFTCAMVSTIVGVSPSIAEQRVALIVGNSSYRYVSPLNNPANDAQLMASTLRDLGFMLIGGGALIDLDKPSLDRAVQAFGVGLRGAEVGLFYYSGHGVQVRGANYIVPIDANATREADIDFQMLDANLVLRQMEAAGTRLNIAIFDACRNNPFAGRGTPYDCRWSGTDAGPRRHANLLCNPTRAMSLGTVMTETVHTLRRSPLLCASRALTYSTRSTKWAS